MNDLFRAIFGIPYFDGYTSRMDKQPPNENNNRDDPRRMITGGDDDDDDDDDHDRRIRPRGGLFGFPLFTDPVEIHKHFDRLVEEMNRAFRVFGFHDANFPSITWGDENANNPNSDQQNHPEGGCSLRDAYLKQPDCGCDKAAPRDDYDKVMSKYEPGTSRDTNPENPNEPPYTKLYSKSVYIQSVQRPDGTIETIKKVRDHTGNEETTITHSNVNDPNSAVTTDQDGNPVQPRRDSSGMSILKKFFQF